MINRKKRINSYMEKYNLDVLVASTPENVAYVSGYSTVSHWRHPARRSYAVIKKNGEVSLIVPAGSCDAVFQYGSEISDIRTYGEFFMDVGSVQLDPVSASFLKALNSSEKKARPIELLTVALKNCQRIGLDEQRVTAKERLYMETNLGNVEIIDAYDIWKQIRSVKNQDEIKLIEKSTIIAETGLKASLEALSQGGSEADAELAFRSAVTSEGATTTFFFLGSGYRGAWQVGKPCDRVPLSGEPIRFDVGCIYQGYHSDIARTVVKRPVPAEIIKNYNAVLKGMEAGLAIICTGVTPAEIFSVIVDAVRKNGIKKYMRHHVGHGEGLEGYDFPLLTPDNRTPLEIGTVLCLEVPYYKMGLGGFHVEDTLVVTDAGYRLLSKMPRDLIEL